MGHTAPNKKKEELVRKKEEEELVRRSGRPIRRIA